MISVYKNNFDGLGTVGQPVNLTLDHSVNPCHSGVHRKIQDVYCIADDILVVGQGETRDEANRQHDLNFFALMKRAQERNLKFNPQEIEFKLPKITFMGHVISDQGVEGHK